MQISRPSAVKRFYSTVEIAEKAGAYQIRLDGRELKTPGRNSISLQNLGLAEAVASEWRAQGEQIRPETLPVTKLINSALDGVAFAEEKTRQDIVRYASSDLVLYRAAFPEELVNRQAQAWDPVLAWATKTYGPWVLINGDISPIPQPTGSLASIESLLRGYGALQLAALYNMTTLTGSALITLCHAAGSLSLRDAWQAAHIDEDWQIAQWGEDHEAMTRQADRFRDMSAASLVFFAA